MLRTLPRLLILMLAVPLPARPDITNTLHNLTPTGVGAVKNPDPVGLCRFCHTPHGAGQSEMVWNRPLPTEIYDLYDSTTMMATPAQPTGTTRLCLSCHDGTIALGEVLEPGPDAVAALGPLEGRVLLTTDLSDDHPVSFVFDEALTLDNGELVSPSTLTEAVQLDAGDRLQCTSCHDPHSDTYPKFLVEPMTGGQLCLTCHAKRGWEDSSHANSPATWNGVGDDPWPESPLTSVADNACLSCHDIHSAARPERLLRSDPEEQVCFTCHTGNVASTDIETQFAKLSAHPISATAGVHQPPEDPLTMDRHVTCADCHNPHAVTTDAAQPPDVPGRQRFVRGLDLGGAPVEEARFAYEICFKCHGVTEQPALRVVRLDNVTNVRLEVHAGNPSYHPVTAIGTNPDVLSLVPPLNPSSQIYCHDCHDNDETASPEASAPRGPHGSINEPILAGSYPLSDFIPFDEARYGLCFGCHRWDNGLRDVSAFEHKRHMENADAPCAACHDPHGSRTNTHLINFMRFDENGLEVVRPSVQTGRLEYIDEGNGRGRCYLNCHGEEHCPKQYIGNDKGEECE